MRTSPPSGYTSSRMVETYRSAVAVERAVDMLMLLGERGEATLTELARTVGSSGSAAHRILSALAKKGLVHQTVENGPYSLTWGILALTQRMSSGVDLRAISLPFMISLRDLTEETVTVNVRSGFSRVCIDQIEPHHEVRWHQQVGRISPLYAGSTGRAILAHFKNDELEEYFRLVELKQITPFTIVTRRDLRRELASIRKRGYALALSDRILGVAAISAPIFDREGAAIAAITIAGPDGRCESQLDSWVEPLLGATREISEILALQTTQVRYQPPTAEPEPILA